MLRLLVSIIILVSLFVFVGIDELLATFLKLRWDYVLLLLFISVVMIWLSCLKWQVFILASGNHVGVGRLMWLYTIGYFFNTFSPSYIGGDIARSYHLGQLLGSQSRAFVTTFLERFTGLVAMSLLGVLFVCIGAPATAGVEWSIVFVAFMSVSLALVCFSEACARPAFGFAEKLCPERFRSLLIKVREAMTFARGNVPLFIRAMGLSFLFHISTVVNTYLAAKAVGWEDPSFSGLFVVVPLVLLVGMLPLTPSGLGIQEGAFLFFLERIGGERSHALGVGLVLRAKVVLIALLGALLFAASGRKKADA